MNERIVLETDWCEHCNEHLERQPFQPDPTKKSEWVWIWVHYNTKRTACEGLMATPRRVKDAAAA